MSASCPCLLCDGGSGDGRQGRGRTKLGNWRKASLEGGPICLTKSWGVGAQRKGKLVGEETAVGHMGSSVPLGHRIETPTVQLPSKDNKETAF